MSKLKKKVALITGGSRGLGFEIAEEFAKQGADVIICGRDTFQLARAKEKIWGECSTKSQYALAYRCDISNPEQVYEMVENVIYDFGKIDILVNNAAVHGAKGNFDIADWDEWLEAINVNLLGSAYMIKKVLPYMKKANKGKIIQLSGGGATAPFPSMSAYATSKAGVVRLIETIAKEMQPFNIDANCLAPGLLNTRLVDDILENKDKVNPEYYERILEYKNSDKFMPIRKAVELCLFLASDESNGITGKLISAQWDNWEMLVDPTIKEKAMISDIFTIRRIIGGDRGMEVLDL